MEPNGLPWLEVKEVDWVCVNVTKEVFINTGYTEVWIVGVITEIDLMGMGFTSCARNTCTLFSPDSGRATIGQ